jgi:hypothetical protein
MERKAADVCTNQYPTPEEIIKRIIAHIALRLVNHLCDQVQALLWAQLFVFLVHTTNNVTNVK